jgi:cytochrome c553
MNTKIAGFWLNLALGSVLCVTAQAATVDGVEVSDRFCLTCHGTDGQGNQGIDAPRLAGMERWYLKRQLEIFRDGLRGTHPNDIPGMEMQPMAVILTDESIQDILDWVASWEYIPAEITMTAGDAARGQNFYQPCAACHGSNAEGNAALNAPALAGQNDWYLMNQLVNFKNGYRGDNPRDQYGSQMRVMAQTIPDENAMRDIVAYINTLGR